MRIARVEYQRYRVPFRTPFTTSHGTEHERHGLLVRVTTNDGVTGLGEAGPLPAFGTGTADDSERWIQSLGAQLTGQSLADVPEILNAVAGDPTAAPARFAFDTAALDIEAKHAGMPLARRLSPGMVNIVPVNATVSAGDPGQAIEAAAFAISSGYRAIKLKVGFQNDLDEEIIRIRSVHSAICKDIELRLDANGAWSLKQAKAVAERLHDLNIAYLEQPLPPDDLAGAVELRSSIDIKIAADEAATSADAVRRIIGRGAADVLVLKPGVVGGLRPAQALIQLAHEAGIRVVVTTALETGVGITAALHLAATLPQPVPACGLATGSLLETDLLVESPQIVNGGMPIPAAPGLGVDVANREWKQ